LFQSVSSETVVGTANSQDLGLRYLNKVFRIIFNKHLYWVS